MTNDALWCMEGPSHLTIVFLMLNCTFLKNTPVHFPVFSGKQRLQGSPLSKYWCGGTLMKKHEMCFLSLLFLFPIATLKKQQVWRPSAIPRSLFGPLRNVRFCHVYTLALDCRVLYVELWLVLRVRCLHISGIIKMDLNYGEIFTDCKK